MSKITVKEAIDTLVEALESEGKDPGSYYYTWQANIAMAFKDEFYSDTKNELILCESTGIHDIANNAAKNFLDMLISTTNYVPGSDSF